MAAFERTIVVFTASNARIFRNPPDSAIEKFVDWPNAVIDPDLSLVEGIPPHFWKLKDGVIVPMNDLEKLGRMNYIERYGVDNLIAPQVIKFKKKLLKLEHVQILFYVLFFALFCAIYHKLNKG